MIRVSSQDVRLAARSFARHRGFTTVAVLSLALAIALNTTMYSVIDALIRPEVAARDPDQLYMLRLWGDAKGKVDNVSRAALIRSGFRTYEAATYARNDFTARAVEWGRQYALASSTTVAPDYFAVLGVTPVRGRVFGDADFVAAPQPIMISQRLANKLSPNSPFVVGTVIQIDGNSHPVIGVLGKGMGETDVWRLPPPGTHLAGLVPNLVRLRRGVTLEQAESEFAVFASRVAQLADETSEGARFELKRINKPQFQFLNFHLALVSAVVAVLLVACANIANLQLARGLARGRELALRTALGASRRQIIAQLLLESALLAGAGLIAGLLLTLWGTALLESRIPGSVADYIIAPQITWRVFAVAVAASLVCTILIGLVPAIRVSRVDPNELLKSGAGTGTNRRNRRQYSVMVVAEIGLALALLCGAALVVRTALRVRDIEIGYDPKPLAAAWIYVRPARDTTMPLHSLIVAVEAHARGIPGVQAMDVYLYRSVINHAVTVDERGGSPRQVDAPRKSYHVVTPAHFRTFGRPLLKGRDFLDGIPAQPEVIVDQQTARALWPGVDPIGMQIKLGEYKSDAPWVRVVGVVADRTENSLKTYSVPIAGTFDLGDIYYLPAAHERVTVSSRGMSVNFVARSNEPSRVAVALRRELSKVLDAVFASAASMEELLGIVQQRLRHEFVASLFALFAVLAIGLAALGVHGIVAHSVAERTRELGVRVALGASSRNIIQVVLREGNAVALIGLAVGLYFTKRSAGWLEAFTFEDDRYDAPLFAVMAAVLFFVTVLSALWPAIRATRVDPVESLRSE